MCLYNFTVRGGNVKEERKKFIDDVLTVIIYSHFDQEAKEFLENYLLPFAYFPFKYSTKSDVCL